MLQNFQEYWQLLSTGQPASAYAHMAKSYLVRQEWHQALVGYVQAHRLKRGLPWNETGQWPTAGQEPLHTGLHKLFHDIEQLTYLLHQGYLPPTIATVIQAYEHLYQHMLAYPPAYLLYQLPPEQSQPLLPFYDRNLYHAPPPACTGSALNPQVDWWQVEQSYRAQQPGWAFADDFLTPAALQGLYYFCLTATIWHDYRKWGGYLGAYMHDGFVSPLLFQIAAELREKLPGIFQGMPLTQMWAYKYDSQRQGIAIHADAAAINVNFWVAPDTANLDPNSGGMVIYDKVAPEEWAFDAYNVDTPAIKRFIRESQAQTIRIPHRQNRMVLFNSSLFHETDEFHFGNAYPERRINITMLFGHRR